MHSIISCIAYYITYRTGKWIFYRFKSGIDGSGSLSGMATTMTPAVGGEALLGLSLHGAYGGQEQAGAPPSRAQLQPPKLVLQTRASLCSWGLEAGRSPALPGAAVGLEMCAPTARPPPAPCTHSDLGARLGPSPGAAGARRGVCTPWQHWHPSPLPPWLPHRAEDSNFNKV